jgi:hypothetical protein
MIIDTTKGIDFLFGALAFLSCTSSNAMGSAVFCCLDIPG